MYQVLFTIPIKTQWTPDGIPVYGFGLMLFLVFVVTSWLAGRQAAREGFPRDKIADLVLWIFLGGLVGARITFMIQYRDQFSNPLLEFFQIWRGGIVFYGSALGGWLTYLLARRLMRLNVSSWQLADVFAPSIAIGLAIGRIGCFLNGCCWGHVAAPGTPFPAHFPATTAPAMQRSVDSAPLLAYYQTYAGFLLDPKQKDDAIVSVVEPGSPAAMAGLKAGDRIIELNTSDVKVPEDLDELFGRKWEPGQPKVTLKVVRGGQEATVGPFKPVTIGLYPTQVYESVTALLIFFVLMSLYPLRRYDGQVFVWLMICYAIHRFLNEMLRNDTDPVAFGLTLSQNGSVLILTAGVVLGLWRRRYPRVATAPAAVPQPA